MRTRREYRYRVVDVFTAQPLEGNPLAVFLDSEGLSREQMQAIAREMNLSETVFVFPPEREDCAARLRIFTPAKEMDFAGHPTVGTSYVLWTEGLVSHDRPQFHLQENVGPVRVSVEAGPPATFWLATPPIHEGPTVAIDVAAGLLGLNTGDLLDATPQVFDAGNPTLLIGVRDPGAVDRAALGEKRWEELKSRLPDPMCVFVFAPTPAGAYSRMFAPDYGLREDPATGSSTGPLAAYLIRRGIRSGEPGSRFVSEQGVRMGRRSLLHVSVEGEGGSDGILVGGEVTPVMEGRLTL